VAALGLRPIEAPHGPPFADQQFRLTHGQPQDFADINAGQINPVDDLRVLAREMDRNATLKRRSPASF
jgi:hypothetical protein